MKKVILVLLLALPLYSFAQKIRFTDSTNYWVTIASGPDCPHLTRYYTFGTDTIIHGTIYRKLISSFMPSGICLDIDFQDLSGFFLREDTLTHKVYYRYLRFFSPDSLEHILYDYNLNAGDTLAYPSLVDSVVSIDSTIINGVYHKILNMQNKSAPFGLRGYSVTEGIGCTNNPVLPAFFGSCFEYAEQLVCFSQHGIYPAIHTIYSPTMCSLDLLGFVNSNDCVVLRLSSNKIAKPPVTISVNPNPANEFFDITTNDNFDNNTTISVYDVTGRHIYMSEENQLKNTITINTSFWNDGLYFVIVQNNNGIIKKEKIVVKH